MSARGAPRARTIWLLAGTTADCQGVERVDNVEVYIRDKFALVVGSEELAKRLRVGHMAWKEALDFLKRIQY